MAETKRRYPKEEFARRGDEIYASKIRAHLTDKDKGKYVAIDIETGAYELAKEELAACDKLRARLPDAQIWMVRVGSPYVHRFSASFRVKPEYVNAWN